ncbi:hypothetical protein N0V90_007488 [Kalmusia sp. IMI 367209]|nr:hypothetical protein N0V90_007488 [Kalmusia sp. IMI 367209]
MAREMVMATETTLSIIQHTQANVTAHGPQYGTQRKIHASTSVANPIGKHPKKSEFVLSAIMTFQTIVRVSAALYLTYYEFKQAIQHLAASKQLNYELNITFSHGRPYFALTWVWFPGLSATINSLVVNVDLRIREPFYYEGHFQSPHDHELAHLIEHGAGSFADQLFDYIAILLKTLAKLLSNADLHFNLLYTENLVLNFRTPTTMVRGLEIPRAEQRRVNVDPEEADELLDTMRNTLKAAAKGFLGFDARRCGLLSPLIQIGSLKFATEGIVWGEGHNMILAHNDFQWLQY